MIRKRIGVRALAVEFLLGQGRGRLGFLGGKVLSALLTLGRGRGRKWRFHWDWREEVLLGMD